MVNKFYLSIFKCSANSECILNHAEPPPIGYPKLGHSTAHYHSDKLFVIDVALGVLLIHQQLFDFIVGQFLAQSGQQMSQFGC